MLFVKYAEDLRLTVKSLAVTWHWRYKGCSSTRF